MGIALLLAGCAASNRSIHEQAAPTPPRKEIEIIATAQIPSNYVVIGKVAGNGVIELEDRARALGGDALSYPHTSTWGRLMAQVLRKQ